MCPEPDFSWQYRSLIQSYRLTPETSSRQLEAILRRFYGAGGGGKPRREQQTRREDPKP